MLSVSKTLLKRSSKSARALVLSGVEAAVEERGRGDNEDMLLAFPNLFAGFKFSWSHSSAVLLTPVRTPAPRESGCHRRSGAGNGGSWQRRTRDRNQRRYQKCRRESGGNMNHVGGMDLVVVALND